MENDNILENSYFNLSYKNQKYNSFPEYKNWKKKINSLGDKVTEIFCKRDNIIFLRNNDDLSNPIKCPKCGINIYICIFCKKTQYRVRCCLKGYIKKIIENYKKVSHKNYKYSINKTLFFIPVTSLFLFFFLFSAISDSFFKENKKKKN